MQCSEEPGWLYGLRTCTGVRLQSSVLSEPSIRIGLHALLLLLRSDEVHHRVDECEVGEGLWEVAVVPACVWVQLFGIEVQRARVAEQFLAEGLPQPRSRPSGRTSIPSASVRCGRDNCAKDDPVAGPGPTSAASGAPSTRGARRRRRTSWAVWHPPTRASRTGYPPRATRFGRWRAVPRNLFACRWSG